MSTTISGTTGVDNHAPDSVDPGDLKQPLTLMAAKSATGTAVDFTGIPSWVKRITVMLSRASTNGSSYFLTQLGTNSGFQTTGYTSQATSGNTPAATTTAGLAMNANTAGAATLHDGHLVITRVAGNEFVATGNFGAPNINGSYSAGSVTLSGTLDRLRVTTVNGTDTFDAGTINVLYE